MKHLSLMYWKKPLVTSQVLEVHTTVHAGVVNQTSNRSIDFDWVG